MDFLPSLSVMLAFTVASVFLCITPGPDMTLFLSRTLSNGKSSGIASAFGTSTGCLVHTMLAVLGISALLAASPFAFWVLKIVGAVYLLWLGYEAVFKGSTFRLDGDEGQETSLLKSYFMGIGINILNPKVVIFFITFLPQFVSVDDPAAWQKMLFLGIMFVVFTLPITIVMVLMAAQFAKKLKQNPKITRIIDWIFGTIFAAFAVRILLAEGR